MPASATRSTDNGHDRRKQPNGSVQKNKKGNHPVAQAKGNRLAIFGELWAFMKLRKKWWLGPIVLTMLLLSVLIVMTQGSAVAPFVYTLF